MEQILQHAENAGENYVVAGPHWSWGNSYPSANKARLAASMVPQPAYCYSRCTCGVWIAGLDGVCFPCKQTR